MLIVLSGFPFASPQKATAASMATDPDKSYVSFKYDTFDPSHSLKDLLQYTSNVNSVPLGWITDTIDNKPKLRLAGEVGTSGALPSTSGGSLSPKIVLSAPTSACR